MLGNNTIEEELRSETPTLAGIVNKYVYAIPVDYFENIAASVLGKINNESENENAFTNLTPYSIPELYFENLSAIILQKTKQTKSLNTVVDELDNIAPLLNTISKEQIYSIPQGYFINTPSIESQTHQKQGKLIAFYFTKIYKLAAAAVITGIVATGSYIFMSKENTVQQAIIEASNTELKKLSEADIVDFLADPGVANLLSPRPATEIHDAVKEISDDEIKQFLQDNEVPEGI